MAASSPQKREAIKKSLRETREEIEDNIVETRTSHRSGEVAITGAVLTEGVVLDPEYAGFRVPMQKDSFEQFPGRDEFTWVASDEILKFAAFLISETFFFPP